MAWLRTEWLDMNGYHLAIRETDSVTGWFNPTTKHFIVPVDADPDEWDKENGRE